MTTMRNRLLSGVAVAAAALTAVLALGALSGPARAATVADGVVDIYTNLGYEGGAAAGTGIVLTANGEVLTNNHVIRGATTIRVVDPSTGRSYRASVAGYDVADDVALLRLRNASGLQTVRLGDSATVRRGDSVTAVGNANGAGGPPAVATGTVTGLGRSLTVGDDRGGAERLTGLIRTSAALQPGDSGGPLLDAEGRVIGIDTAASVGLADASGGEGFAIPINRAMSIARQIESGRSSTAIHVGPTAFLGVVVAQSTYYRGQAAVSAPVVSAVVPGSAADRAGLVPGDVILSFAGSTVRSPAALTRLVLRVAPGTSVKLRWVDRLGGAHSVSVRPAAGPPQ
jgi:S1-C subfamily serine protease